MDQAEEVLAFTTRPIAKQISKILKSAVANAGSATSEEKEKVAVEDLKVRHAVAGAGPTMKRYLPRAQGRATPLLKRSCHITIVVGDEKE